MPMDDHQSSRNCVTSSTSSISSKANNNSYNSSKQNTELVESACEDLLLTLLDMKLTYQAEESELVSRASCLEKEIEMFEKMSPDALVKLRKAT